MSDENKEVLCRHCGARMEHSQTVYSLPEGKRTLSNAVKIDLDRAIDLQVLRCSNPECAFIELKAPKRWPSLTPLG
jgi:hypothetical protein